MSVLRKNTWHRGMFHYRTTHEHSEREKAFAEEWEADNEFKPGLNYGYGILQDLLFTYDRSRFCHLRRPSFMWRDDGAEERPRFIVSKRDAVIVATVIQYLGSNGGWCFLERVLKRCGYKIVKIKEDG